MIKGQKIFRTHFSYFILSRKRGNIHLTQEYLTTVLIGIHKWSERQAQDNFPLFLAAGMVRMGIS